MATASTPPIAANPDKQVSAYRWVVAWIVLILIISAFVRLRIGYVIIYYLAVLTLLFLLVTQYQLLGTYLTPFSQAAAQNTQEVAVNV